MNEIWIYSEDPIVASQLIAYGREIAQGEDQQICAILADQSVARDMISYGADKVHVFNIADDRPESCVTALANMIKAGHPLLVLFGGTLRGKEVAARCAAILETGLTTDALAVRIDSDSIETDRMVYGGLAVSTERLSTSALIGVSPLLLSAPERDESRKGNILMEEIAGDNSIIVEDRRPIQREGVDLTKADKIVCVGRGVAKKEDLDMFYQLANLMGAEVACSRAVSDSQWLPHEVYIGISGVKVKPSLYISFGVSGQVQHLSGMRDSKIIVAVDTNENAPIFAAADYGIVGDLYEVAPLLIKALNA